MTRKHYLYSTWRGMKQRCYYKKMNGYKNWGGRGIKVCDEWKDDFIAFASYIEKNLGDKPPKHSFDRIDNDGDYEPGNVRWASYKEQNNNLRKPPIYNTKTPKSGYKWVSAHQTGKWVGTSTVNGRTKHLTGVMSCPKECYEKLIEERIRLGLPVPE